MAAGLVLFIKATMHCREAILQSSPDSYYLRKKKTPKTRLMLPAPNSGAFANFFT